MRLKITVIVDVADDFKDCTPQEMRQIFWDEFVHYTCVSHLESAVHWAASNAVKNTELIIEHHQKWASYFDNPVWMIEKID